MAAILSNAVSSPVALTPPATASRNRWRDSFRLKLYGLVALATVIVLVLQTWAVYSDYQQQVNAKINEIRSVSQSATGVLTRYAKMVTDGKMERAQAEQAAFEALRGMRFGDNADYVFVWRIADATTVVHGIPAQEGQNQFRNITDSRPKEVIAADRVNSIRSSGGEAMNNVMQKRGDSALLPKMNIIVIFEPWGLVVGTGTWMDRVNEAFQQSLIASLILTAIAALLLIAAGILVVRSVMRQLGGEPAGAVQIMQRAAGGDFSGTTSGGKRSAGSLLTAFGDMSTSIRSMIVNVRTEAGSLRQDAGRLSESVQQVSAAAGHQSEATASMAAAIEELTVSVSHISEAAIETEKLSEGVASLCRSSESQVSSAADGMQRIASAVGEASTKISGLEARAEQINVIAASIKEIASQTNLLALNAAIEAARAGEQGRGFSVVADEVRKLAERTASATVEIEQMVSSVQRETKESTETMAHVRPIVDEGNALTQHVADSLREIRSRARHDAGTGARSGQCHARTIVGQHGDCTACGEHCTDGRTDQCQHGRDRPFGRRHARYVGAPGSAGGGVQGLNMP